MQRLTAATLPALIAEAQTAVILFGSPEGETTRDQAYDFADAWFEKRHHAHFGYVDAFENVGAARAHGIRVLPTTLILRDGALIAKLEGKQSASRIVAAIARGDAPHQAAA